MIIDSHVHVDEVPQLGWMDPPEAILTLMDEAGIEKAIIMTYVDTPGVNPHALEYIANIVKRFSSRFWGYARMHPWYGDRAIELFEHAVKDLGLRGLKLHPVSSLGHPAMESTLALIRKAADLGVPVLYHSGDEAFCTPYEIEFSARAVPKANVIMGHMGGYFHVAEAVQVAARQPNLYLDTSAMPYPAWVRRAIDAIGPERVLFASDGPGCDPRLEVHKVKRAGLTSAEEALVFSGNILRLLEG